MYNSHSISFIKILIQFTFIISIKNKYLPIIILNNRNNYQWQSAVNYVYFCAI